MQKIRRVGRKMKRRFDTDKYLTSITPGENWEVNDRLGVAAKLRPEMTRVLR